MEPARGRGRAATMFLAAHAARRHRGRLWRGLSQCRPLPRTGQDWGCVSRERIDQWMTWPHGAGRAAIEVASRAWVADSSRPSVPDMLERVKQRVFQRECGCRRETVSDGSAIAWKGQVCSRAGIGGWVRGQARDGRAGRACRGTIGVPTGDGRTSCSIHVKSNDDASRPQVGLARPALPCPAAACRCRLHGRARYRDKMHAPANNRRARPTTTTQPPIPNSARLNGSPLGAALIHHPLHDLDG